MDNLLSVPQAAAYLNRNPSLIRKFCAEGRFGRKVGKNWVISRAELVKFKQMKRPPGIARKQIG